MKLKDIIEQVEKHKEQLQDMEKAMLGITGHKKIEKIEHIKQYARLNDKDFLLEIALKYEDLVEHLLEMMECDYVESYEIKKDTMPKDIKDDLKDKFGIDIDEDGCVTIETQKPIPTKLETRSESGK